MRIKDFTDTIRHLTDPFNIPEARRMIQENPALTQEQFKAGGIVEPGVAHYAKKLPWETTKSKREILAKTDPELLARTDMSGKVHDTSAEAIAADKKRLWKPGETSQIELSRKKIKGEKEKVDLYKKILKDKGRKPTVWEMHTGGETRMNLDKIRRIMEKHDLRLSNPRGALKKDILKIYDQLKDTNVEDYMRRFGKEGFPREWADLNERQQDLDTMFDAFGNKKHPQTKDIYEMLPETHKKKWKDADSLKSQIAEYLNQEKKSFRHSDEMWSEGAREKAAKTIRDKGKKTESEYIKEYKQLKKDIDPVGIKRDVTKATKGVGKATHHPFQKRYGESLEKLMPTSEVLNRMDDAEWALKRIDAHKAIIENNKAPGWEKELKKWEAVENRIIKQKSIEGITLPKTPAGKNPKLVTAEDPLYYDPKRKGLLGRMETVVSPEGEITHKAKGVSKKKTFAGMSEHPLAKKKFSEVVVGKGEKSKIVNHMTNVLKGELDCTLAKGKNCNTPEGYRKSFNELVEKAAANDKASITKMQRILKGMKKLKGPLKWTGYGILGEIGFMVPFAAADYTKGESWKRIMGNASDWGFGPMFGQSEDEEIISYLPEGSLGAETEIAKAAHERLQVLEDPNRNFPKGRIGMDPQRFQKAQAKVISDATLDLQQKIDPFMEGPRDEYFNTDLALQSMEEWKAAQKQVQLEKLKRIAERRDRGFIAEEGWEKNVRRGRMGGGITSLKK